MGRSSEVTHHWAGDPYSDLAKLCRRPEFAHRFLTNVQHNAGSGVFDDQRPSCFDV